MKLPVQLSLRTELLIAFAMFLIVNVLSAMFQTQIFINDGKGWDGASYYVIAQQLSDGQSLSADAPFVYRIGTPFLASIIDKDNLLVGFKIVNFVANAVMSLLLLAWLRLFIKDWRIRLALVAAFLLEWHGPVRFLHFYPIAADNWFVTLLLAGLLVIHALRNRLSWMLIVSVSALALLGTLVRESGLLLAVVVPLARSPLHLRRRRISGIPLVFLIPLGLAIAGFAAVHAVAHLTNIAASNDGPLIVPKSIPAYTLGWWTAFGPLLVLPLFTWRRTVAFLWQHQYMFALLAAVTLLSSFQSPALQLQLQDTERYLFWAMPVVYVLIGRALEQLLPIVSRPLLGLLVVGQAFAERVFWTIPQPGLPSDPASVFNHGSASLLLFTPLGSNVEYFDIFPAWMSQAYRLTLLAEYVAFGLVLVGWLYWRSTHAGQARSPISVNSTSSQHAAQQHAT